MATCEPVRLPDGTVVLVRRRPARDPKCFHCRVRPGDRQCDGPSARPDTTGQAAAERGTCDRWLCRGCATHVAPNMDFCLEHRPDVLEEAR